ncbi:hypothetical protein PHLGIDRAFT_133950 [Phlebiopsis gigantea 11061_1 CR5-6]|uniref:F-box domain-containing protein n=1 Tax=Phlebiopsis gigantea (strain 11061_1 CR5-6) TaxID=745531 RepID=A0A0C3SFV2_PHLG1|nr:hypothetical protein PHLGIDRAFT_133950 [Phlebiopsis gigantea 11061_1 CR5-6]
MEMEGGADALVIDATTCLSILERLLALSPLEFQSRQSTVRQLLILEDCHQFLPGSFSDSSRHLLRHDIRRLFPQIVALRAQAQTSPCMRATALWAVALGQSLTTLYLHASCDISADTWTAALSSIRGRFPCLQVLDIRVETQLMTPGQTLDLALHVVAFCDGLQSLTTLSVPADIVETAWQQRPHALSQLPMLQKLSLSRTTSPHHPRHIFPVGGFSALRTLQIATPLAHSSQLVRAVGVAVPHLSLECDELQSGEGAIQALTDIIQQLNLLSNDRVVLAESCSSRTANISSTDMNALFLPRGVPRPVLVSCLTELDINIRLASPNDALSFTLTPMSSAHSLQKLSIRYPYALSYTAEDVRDMLGSWPRMRCLSLNPRPPHGVLDLEQLPALSVLAAVAESGPCLRQFGALLDCSTRNPRQPQRTWSPSLQKLDLGHSLGFTETSPCTAHYILSLFSLIELVTEDCSDFVRAVDSTVNSLIKV